jgi:hypothetical protein
MLDRDRQLCSQCEYDVTGLGLPGRLVRCPECGKDNRMGHLDLDSIRPTMPPWWRLGFSLGWPMLVWAYFALIAWRSGDQPMIVAAVILGGLVLFVALSRAAMIAFDCSIPHRRAKALTWTMLWAIVGSVGVLVLAGGAIFALWGLIKGIEAVRPGGS